MSVNEGALGVIAALAVAGLVLYAGGLRIPYFADDFQLVFDGLQWNVLTPFYKANPNNGFYRPLQNAFLVGVQGAFGDRTWPIHAFQLALHVALSGLVYAGGLRTGLTRLQAGLAAVFMLAAQADVHAVLGNDTLSQVGSALFGYLSLYVLCKGLQAAESSARWHHMAASAGCLAAALLFKETGVAFFPMLLLVLFRPSGGDATGRWTRMRQALAFAIVLGLYLVIRSLVLGTLSGSGMGRYALQVGPNVLRNAALFVLAIVTVLPSVTVYALVQGGTAGDWLGALLPSAFFALIIIYGLVRLHRPRWVGMLVVLAVFSLAPAYFLNHVSELYVYNAIPPVALLVGAGLGGFVEGVSRRRLQHGLAWLVVLTFFGVHVASVERKTALMAANGVRAARLLPEVVEFVKTAPAGGAVLLCNGDPAGVSYSVFLIHGFDVLSYAAPVIRAHAGRDDVEVRIVRPGEDDVAGAPTVVLGLDAGGQVVPQEGGC